MPSALFIFPRASLPHCAFSVAAHADLRLIKDAFRTAFFRRRRLIIDEIDRAIPLLMRAFSRKVLDLPRIENALKPSKAFDYHVTLALDKADKPYIHIYDTLGDRTVYDGFYFSFVGPERRKRPRLRPSSPDNAFRKASSEDAAVQHRLSLKAQKERERMRALIARQREQEAGESFDVEAALNPGYGPAAERDWNAYRSRREGQRRLAERGKRRIIRVDFSEADHRLDGPE